jgi:hypothetical protein
MSVWNEYIAAGLLNAVSREITCVPEKLVGFFFEKYGLVVDSEDISTAVDLLVDCGIAYSEDDSFAGRFVKISRSRCGVFLAAVEEELDPSFKGRNNDSGTIWINRDIRRPNLSKYNKYPVLKRYHEFGREFIEQALQTISIRGYENGTVPASDRMVTPSDNQEAYDNSVASLAELESELRISNEAGDVFGDDRQVAAQEISTLQILIAGARVRSEPTLAFAKKCLSWIAEKAGAAAIGELAKRALASLIAWLS